MSEQLPLQEKKKGKTVLWIALGLILLAVLLLITAGIHIYLNRDGHGVPSTPTEMSSPVTHPTQITVPPTTVPPTTVPPTQPPVVKVSTATIGSTGDILLHKKVIRSGYDQTTDTYNYDSAFSAFSEFVSKMDYAVANLEVTLGAGPYTGYPTFNAPDAIVDALKNAGFDMLLTANNHCFDTGSKGFFRTQQIIRERELQYTGTRTDGNEKNYLVADINGIKVGMICYTYNTGVNNNGVASVNGIGMTSETSGLLNHFDYQDQSAFYEKLSAELSAMRGDGAEALMVYLHWGDEYKITPNKEQKEMAQMLCDMGVDVIVGNHPHVPQPVELLTNTQDESRKTLCLYSMGNALSNIRRGKNYPVQTEDGLLFQVTFAKYSDGTVLLERADILPTWVDRYTENGISKFRILAMDDARRDTWQADMNLTDEILKECQASYDRTMEIVGTGLETANGFFAGHQQDTENRIGVTQ